MYKNVQICINKKKFEPKFYCSILKKKVERIQFNGFFCRWNIFLEPQQRVNVLQPFMNAFVSSFTDAHFYLQLM